MRFPFNAWKDPVINQLTEYAGSEEICEQSMHNAARDPERIWPMPISLIIKHIDRINNERKKKD